MKPMKFGAAALAWAVLSAGGTAWAASVVDLPYETMEMHDVSTEGTLVFSDSPEFVEETGILAEGTIRGRGRIYYYHVNEMNRPVRLVVYAQSQRPAKVTVTRQLQADPTWDYIALGRKLSFEEMVTVRSEPREVALTGQGRMVIAEERQEGLTPDFLYSGIIEVETDRPVRFGVAALPVDEDLQSALDSALPVPVDEHGLRGTFPMTVNRENVRVWNTDTDGPQAFYFGGEEAVPFYHGTDELDGVVRENTGDYGINFRIRVETEGTRPYRIYFNPQGGIYMGSFKITQGRLPLFFRTDDMKYRRHLLGYDTLGDYIEVGRWEAGKPLTIDFLPAGATFLPVRFLFVPETV